MIFNEKEYETREELEADEVFQTLSNKEKEVLIWLFE